MPCYYVMNYTQLCIFCNYIQLAAQAVRLAGIPKVASSILNGCSKSCDLYPALQSAILGAQGVLPCVLCGVRPVNWIYRL